MAGGNASCLFFNINLSMLQLGKVYLTISYLRLVQGTNIQAPYLLNLRGNTLQPRLIKSLIIRMQKRGSQKPQQAQKYTVPHIELEDVSEHHSHLERAEEEALPAAIEEELGLNLQKYSREIKEEIRYILLDLLKYPSSAAAERHRASNRLGSFDLKHTQNKQAAATQYYPSHHPPQTCEDCGLAVQEREIAACASVWEFPRAGEGVFHLFENAKLLAGQVFVLGVFFSIFSLYVSVVEPTEALSLDTLPRKVSYTALMLYGSSNSILTTLLSVQAFLIVLTTLLWWFLQFISICLRQKYELVVEQEDLSAADFTIMLDNVPAHYTKETLQNEFNRYFESLVYHHNLKQTWGEDLRPFEIDRVSQVIPFGLSQGEVMDQELEGLDQDIVEKRKLLAEWMLEFKENSRFTFQRSDRQREYQNFERMLERRRNKLQQMEERAREHYRLPQGRDLHTVYFVSFRHSQSAGIIEQLNPQPLPAKLRYLLTCCRTAQYFSVRDELTNEEIAISTTRAPDPQDIIWGNLRAPLKARILSRLLTWAFILGLWGATFGVCYGLNYFSAQQGLTFMPVVLAVVVTLANLLAKFGIRLLSSYERDETESNRQRGILIKSLIALVVNWVATPAVIALLVNLNIYDTNGLVYFVFFLAITNALVPPLLRIFDPAHYFRRLRAAFKNRPYKKMELRQSELNAFLENEEYELGWSYAYFIQLFYFTCLYAPMLPFVVIPTLAGYFFMFWAEKYALLHRSKRPPQNMKTLTSTAHTAMLLGPLFLGVGGLVWVCLFSSDFSSMTFIGYMVEIGLGVLYFLTPFTAIFKCFCNVPDEEIMVYEDCRTKFATEYERLNPVTAEKGIADYLAFLKRKKAEDKATALNLSEGNLMDNMDVSLMLEGVTQITKIPNIFGKNTEITRKIDGESFKSRVRQKHDDIVFVTPQNNTVGIRENEKDIEDFEIKFNDRLSRAETEKKPTMVVNYNSSGNGYIRRKAHNERRTISVLQGGSYEPILETQSQKH